MDKLYFIVFVFVVLISVSILIFGGPSAEQKMYQHCIEDGIKDYVCYQMMYRPAEYVPMPMPIPMRTK